MSEYDSNFVYMPLKEAQKYFSKKDKVNTIEIFLDKPEELDPALIKIREIVMEWAMYLLGKSRIKPFLPR